VRYVSIDQVEPGQFLGKTIFNHNGTVLLSEGVQLTVAMISTLRRIGVTHLFVRDKHLEDVEIPEVVSEETKRLVMERMVETFQAIRSGKDFNTRAIAVSIDRMIEEIMQNREVLVQLSEIRTKDNAMYIHAINVSMMSVLTGINLGLNQMQLKELAIGALLHDVGKVELITDDAAPDPKLHHTWRGFELLKHKREFSLLIAHVALQHHETPDGEGVPRGLEGEQIHPYAKIVAVANTYDNLLHRGPAGKPMLPHEACEYLMALSGTKLDHETLIQFLRIVSVYPTGTCVRLSTRETGVVVGQHRGLPGRPVVRIVRQRGEDDYEVKEIDLARHPTIFIEQVIT